MDVSLTQSALPRVKAWAGESNAERDSCEGHCNYSLSVMAARALAAGLVKSTLMLMEGTVLDCRYDSDGRLVPV